jgi:hypothetical protein
VGSGVAVVGEVVGSGASVGTSDGLALKRPVGPGVEGAMDGFSEAITVGFSEGSPEVPTWLGGSDAVGVFDTEGVPVVLEEGLLDTDGDMEVVGADVGTHGSTRHSDS